MFSNSHRQSKFLLKFKGGENLLINKMPNMSSRQHETAELGPVSPRAQAETQSLKVATVLFTFFLQCCGFCITLTWLLTSSDRL